MIIVKLWGGLGNQIFQYAFGYMMSKEHQDQLLFDISFYQKHQYKYVGKREYELDKLKCPVEIATKLPLSVRFLESFAVNRGLRRIRKALAFPIGNVFFVKEEKRRFMSNIPYRPNRINYYDGYWQSCDYFKKYEKDLRDMLQPGIEMPQEILDRMEAISNDKNSVSVHVRKGDFQGKIGHAVGIDYYQKAIQGIRDKIQQPVFYVFSDNIPWVKENIDFGKDVVFADDKCQNGQIFDLTCMSKCQHGIMSASTYSWWGNWEKDGMVMVPDGEYFNNRFFRDAWIRL
jgi:hypothetical protein